MKKRSNEAKRSQPIMLLLPLVSFALGCAKPLDTTRPAPVRQSLGHEMYAEFCRRLAHDSAQPDPSGESTRTVCDEGAPPAAEQGARLGAFHAKRERFIAAIDTAVPPTFAPELNRLLQRMTPLYDTGDVQGQTRALALVLGHLTDSSEALSALERLGARQGYRPLALSGGLLRPTFNFAELDATLKDLSTLVATGGAGAPGFRLFLGGMQRELADLAVRPDPITVPSALRDLLLLENDAFGDGVPRLIARRDVRGVAVPALGPSGAPLSPFVDLDHDGAADIDASGQLVGANGRPLALATPFAVAGEAAGTPRDTEGRLLTSSGDGLVYQYRDASRTLLSAVLQEARTLIAKQRATLLDLVPPLGPVLGPRAPAVYTFVGSGPFTFSGIDLAASPALDLMHASTPLLASSSTLGALSVAAALLDTNELELARAAALAVSVADWADSMLPAGTSLEPHAAFLDDLAAWVVEVLRVAGLWHDLLLALETPESRALGHELAPYMRYKDEVEYDPVDINKPLVGALSVPVDRAAVDGWSNRSLFQRFVHLTHDVTGARLCNKPGAVLDLKYIQYPLDYALTGHTFGECELFEIPDLAVFYMQAIIGKAEMNFKDPTINNVTTDAVLELLAGVTGYTRHPTYQGVNRVVFGQRNNFLQKIMDPVRAADGGILEERHRGTAPAYELGHVFEDMAPVLNAFNDHGRLDLYAKLMSILHHHWSSPEGGTTQSLSATSPLYADQSGIVRFEELVARALDEGNALPTLGDLMHVFRTTAVGAASGEQVLAELPQLLFLPEANPDYAPRQNAEPVLRNDGWPVAEVAPATVMLSAWRRIAAGLAATPAARDATWTALGHLLRQVLATDGTGPDLRFADRRGYALVHALLDFGRDELQKKLANDGAVAWAAEVESSVNKLVAHPATAGVADLTAALQASPAARADVEQLLHYLVDEQSPNHAFACTLLAGVDLAQVMNDTTNLQPVLRDLAPVFDADKGLLAKLVDFAAKLRDIDDRQVLPALLANLVQEPANAPGETALDVIVDVISEVNRQTPGAGGRFTVADFKATLGQVHDFLLDDTRGLERIYKLIEKR